jgi:hypothetical protein
VRSVMDVVVLEIAARGARRRRAAPAVAGEDRISGEIFPTLRRIPRLDKVLEQGEEADPIRHAPGADGKHPGGETRGGEMALERELALGPDVSARRAAAPRTLFVPCDCSRLAGAAGPRPLQRRQESVREIKWKSRPEENFRSREDRRGG